MRKLLFIALGCAICLGCHTAPEVPSAPVVDTSKPTFRLAGYEGVVVLTGHARPEDRLPIVVALHGMGDTPDHFQALFQDFDLPARILLPHATLPLGDGRSWFAFQRGQDDASLAPGLQAAAQGLATLLAAVPGAWPVQGKPLVTGFSQGGMLSFALAAGWPDLIGGAFPMGGFLPVALIPMPGAQAVSLTVFHGTEDTVIPVGKARASAAAFMALGHPVVVHEYPGGHQISAEMKRDLWRAIKEVGKGR